MDIKVIEGNIKYINDCEDALLNSEIGDIPNLYEDGITECLMMKVKE